MKKRGWIIERKRLSFAVLILSLLVLGVVYFFAKEKPAALSSEEQFLISTEYMLVNSQPWKDFKASYGSNWNVEFNAETNSPKKIIGGGVSSSDFGIDIVTKDNIDNFARTFFGSNTNLIKIDGQNLVASTINERDGFLTASYYQTYNGLQVIDSGVKFAVKNNKMVLFKSNYHPSISISTTPLINKNKAINEAKNFFQVRESLSDEKSALKIYPLKNPRNYALVYQVDLPLIKNPFNESLYSQYTVFIDANSGAIMDYYDNVEYDYLSGNIKGNIFPVFDFPINPNDQVEAVIEDELVSVASNQGITDANGDYLISGLSGSVTLESKLERPWSKFEKMQQQASMHSASLSIPATHNWNWKDYDSSYKQEESNVFYHTNVIHDYVTKPLLNVNELNLQMKVRVNYDSHCNAFAAGDDSINFYSAGNGCESTGLDTGVIYHEYGHRVNRKLVNQSWPYWDETGNMNEGIADYWGCTILNDPCHSRYRQPDQECSGRRCDTDDRYPEDYDPEPHSGAQIVSGALWDLREIYGADIVDKWVVDSLRLAPMSFSELIEGVLISDDDNGNLDDGTPHINDICHAFFDNRGMFSSLCLGYIQGVAVISYPKIGLANIFPTKDQSIIVKGIAYGNSSSPLSRHVLEYSSQDNPENWILIASSEQEVVNGVLGIFNITELEGTYNLRLSVYYGSEVVVSYPIQVIVDKYLRQGWPVDTSHWIGTSPLIGDLDNDEYNDIIMGSWSRLYALNYTGNFLPGWLYRGMYTSFTKPAMGDLDNDGNNEAVFVDAGGYIVVYRYNGEFYWWYNTSNYSPILGSPTLSDINNDNKLEAIFGADNGYIFVFSYNGSLIWSKQTIGKIRDSPSIGDLDNDGNLEIVVSSFNYETNEFKIYVYNNDGSYFIQPINVSLTNPYLYDTWRKYESSPALADIDSDGYLEILLGLPDGILGVWNYNGSLKWSYYAGYSTYSRSPAIGDLDNDGNLEIVSFASDKLSALHHNGSLVRGWPKLVTYMYSSPLLYDLDGDGYLEVIASTYPKIYVFKNNGTEIYKNSFTTKSTTYGTPAIGDLDNNGKPDIVVGSHSGYIFAWELYDTAQTARNYGWPTLHFDNYNTGKFEMLGCGNGILNYNEDCELDNFNGQSCQTLGFKTGILQCNTNCKFDISQCSEPLCNTGEHYNYTENSCTAFFISDSEDNSIFAYDWDWSNLRHSESGRLQNSSYKVITFLMSSDASGSSIVYRASVPFNTSSIPDKVIIKSAELKLTHYPYYSRSADTHNSSDNFITIVPTTLANTPVLSTEDFDQFSFIDNPVELANRIKSNELYINGSAKFIFNNLDYINKTGYTSLGLRFGYDLLVERPNNGEFTRIDLDLYSMNSNNPPELKITYLLPRSQCYDEKDNDNDGKTDYPNDFGCASLQDNNETGFGNLSIVTKPTGAKIYLNGIYKGNTNRNITNLKDGIYKLVLSKAGYVNYTANVTIYDSKITYVNANLSLDVGKLDVKSTPNKAGIYLDSVYKGLTNRTLTNIKSGIHLLRINKTGYFDYVNNSVGVFFNKTTYFNVKLQRNCTNSDEIGIDGFPSGNELFKQGITKGVLRNTSYVEKQDYCQVINNQYTGVLTEYYCNDSYVASASVDCSLQDNGGAGCFEGRCLKTGTCQNHTQCSQGEFCVNGQCSNLCGNGIIDDNEECEFSLQPYPCTTPDGYKGTKGCNIFCKFNTGCQQIEFSDNFNRADGSLGGNWITVKGSPMIKENGARNFFNSTQTEVGALAEWYYSFGGNFYSEVKVLAPSGAYVSNSGPVLFINSNNYYTFQSRITNPGGSSGYVIFYKMSNGSLVSIKEYSNINFPAVLKIAAKGKTFKLYVNGNLLYNHTETTIPSIGKAGFIATSDRPDIGTLLDDWKAGPNPYCGDGYIELNFDGFNEVCDKNSQLCTTTNGYPGMQQCLGDCSGFNSCVTYYSCNDGICNGNENSVNCPGDC